MQTTGLWVSTKQAAGGDLCRAKASFLSQSTYWQVHGPSVPGLVLATENEKARLVVYFSREHAPTAGFDLSKIRQLNKAFPNFNTCWKIELT